MLSALFAGLARRLRGRGSHMPEADVSAGRSGGATHFATHSHASTDAACTEDLEAMFQAAVEQARSGGHEAAGPRLRRMVAAMPDRVDALDALANTELLCGRYDEARELYRQALAIDTASSARWANLGLCLRNAGALEEAEEALRRALLIDPTSLETRLSLALVRIDRGALQEAEQYLRQLLAEDPQFAEAHTALSHLLLLSGRFAEGWLEYEWRLRLPSSYRSTPLPVASWDGRPAHDRTLLITAEQGLGDQIMLLSCLGEAIARVGKCWLECDPRLVGIVARSFPEVCVIASGPVRDMAWLEHMGRPDLQVALGSLPRILRATRADFPVHRGYLHADSARVGAWRARLRELGSGTRIGISWRGGAATTRGVLRSIALRNWQPIFDGGRGNFVSLQYGDCQDEIRSERDRLRAKLWHFPDAIADYDETAALVGALDLVVTVQTAIAHLAGAMGKEVWILVPVAPEWRYMADGEGLPWYPSARVFRQQRFGDWDGVIMQVAEQLDARGARPRA